MFLKLYQSCRSLLASIFIFKYLIGKITHLFIRIHGDLIRVGQALNHGLSNEIPTLLLQITQLEQYERNGVQPDTKRL